MQLRLEPASGAVIPALGGAPVTQRMTVTNTMHGSKPVAMRLRLAYSQDGQQVVEQAEVTAFPPGL
jgi:AP-1 complex subunit gamma-1